MKKVIPISIGAALIVAAGAVGIAFAASVPPAAQPEPTVVSETIAPPRPTVTSTPTPTPAPALEPVVEAVVPAPEAVLEELPPPEPEPIYCPGGSFAISQDGPNDTLCLPVECEFNSGNPDFPQCDSPFRP